MYKKDIDLLRIESIRVVPLKYLIYFLADINTKLFWNITEEIYLATLRILNLLIKSFVDLFLNFADSSFNSFNSFCF